MCVCIWAAPPGLPGLRLAGVGHLLGHLRWRAPESGAHGAEPAGPGGHGMLLASQLAAPFFFLFYPSFFLFRVFSVFVFWLLFVFPDFFFLFFFFLCFSSLAGARDAGSETWTITKRKPQHLLACLLACLLVFVCLFVCLFGWCGR